jgi:EmrB/QacA subfamily drug resistance transporter
MAEVKTTEADRSAAPEGMSERAGIGLLVICAAQFLVALDLSIANVAVPHIREDLGFGVASVGWVLSAYALAFASLLLIAGRIADLHGRRRAFVASLLLLGGASVLAGSAWSPASLIVGRVLQGLAAAFIAPSALGLLTATIPEGPQRQRALGIYGAILSTGFVSGMVGGGVLTETLSWRWTMYVNVPVVLIAAALALRYLPESRVRHSSRLDIPGSLLSAAAMVCAVYALSEAEGGVVGAALASTALLLLASAGLTFLFVWIERRSRSPILPMSLFSIGAVGGANLIGLVMVASYGGMLIILTLYLQEVLGYGALTTGLVFAVSGTIAIVTGTLTGRLMQRVSLDRLLLFGITFASLGLLALVLLPVGGGLWLVLAATSVNAFGHIIVLVVVSVAATNGVPSDNKAVAGAVLNTAQQLGIALGVALLTSVSVVVTTAQSEPQTAAAVVTGWRWALGLATVLAVTTIPLTVALGKRLRD